LKVLASCLLGLHDQETLFNSPWPFPARPRSMEPQLAGRSGKIAGLPVELVAHMADPHSALKRDQIKIVRDRITQFITHINGYYPIFHFFVLHHRAFWPRPRHSTCPCARRFFKMRLIMSMLTPGHCFRISETLKTSSAPAMA